ncbi:MAG: hypothetical protein OXO53_07065 [Chloroflexota bacterium]|nr:hypothetical protein [Chloroflexota bacterium]
MVLKGITCPACGGRNFTLEEVVEDDTLTGLDLRCARGCGFYTYEAGDRSAWSGIDGKVAAVQPLACRDGHVHHVAGVYVRQCVRCGEPEQERRAS